MKNSPISLLIVDDEVLARVGIKSLLDWDAEGFRIVGEMENGEKALDAIEALHPELVITDIKMPKMNGLELIKKAKARYPRTEFIVISSYDDFRYAKEAITIGARDYLLKLEMDKDSLTRTVTRLKQEILSNRKNYGETGSYTPEKQLVLENQELREIILKGGESSSEHPFTGRKYYLIYFLAVSPRGKIYDADERSSFQTPVLNLIREILTDYDNGYVCCLRPMEYAILYAPTDENEKQSTLTVKRMAERIIETLGNYINLSALVSISGPERGEATRLYKKARDTVQGDYVYPCGTLLPADKFGREYPLFSPDSNRTLKNITHRLSQGDYEEASLAMKALVNSIPLPCRLEKTGIKSLCYEIGLAVLKANDTRNEGDSQKLFQELELLVSGEDYKHWLSQTADFLQDRDRKTKKVSPLINRAVTLLDKHYREEISLSDMAENLEVSGSYLSQQFKKEMGKTFTDYLTDIRIEKAAALLLETNEPIQEIARKVGYDNIYYFSRVFKRTMGQPPREFRKKNIPE